MVEGSEKLLVKSRVGGGKSVPDAPLKGDDPRPDSAWAEKLRASLDVGRAFTQALEQRRVFVALPFMIILGLIANAVMQFDPHPLALGLLALGVALGLYLYRNEYLVSQGLFLALGFVAGFGLLAVHGAIHGGPMLAYPAYGSYRAQVDQVLRGDETARRVIVSKIVALEPGGRDLPIRRARIFVRGGPVMRPGDVIEGNFRFAKVPGPIVPGGFDFQFHAYFDGIGSYASATGPVRVTPAGMNSWQRMVDGMRRAIGARIDVALEQPARGIARALVIGDQSQITDDTRSMMAAAGLAHVLAISGLHLTLVAGGVFGAVRIGLAGFYGLGQRVSVKKLSALVGAAAAVFYLVLSGASVSATRATIMLLLVFGAVIAGRRALTMRNVAIAALIVILLDPAAVFRPSFQLSFAAVVGLIAVYEMTRQNVERARAWWQRILRFFAGTAFTSLIAGLATAIFAAYHFQQTALLGVLGNIAALPLVGFVVLPAGFLGVLVMPLGGEGVFFQAMAWGVEIILGIAEVVAGWSAPIAAAPLLGPAALVICLVALGWLAFVPTRMRFIGVLLAVPLIALFGRDVAPDVLISDSSKAVAMRLEDGLGLISGRSPSFATTAWEETYMQTIAKKPPHVACDKGGCIGTSALGFDLALIKRTEAFGEECGQADLIVSHLRAPQWCKDMSLVVDAEDLRLGGVHMLYWDQTQAKFELRKAITSQYRDWRVPF